jgi:hypothetical protein
MVTEVFNVGSRNRTVKIIESGGNDSGKVEERYLTKNLLRSHQVEIYRPKTNDETKQKAINFMREQKGKEYVELYGLRETFLDKVKRAFSFKNFIKLRG